VTENPLRDRAAHVHAMALRRLSVERRRTALENLRHLEIQLQTASALDRRADRSANPAFAGVLRDRAEERRRIAAIIRAHLDDAGTSRVPREARPLPVSPGPDTS
jgi:hypothetical protein